MTFDTCQTYMVVLFYENSQRFLSAISVKISIIDILQGPDQVFGISFLDGETGNTNSARKLRKTFSKNMICQANRPVLYIMTTNSTNKEFTVFTFSRVIIILLLL